MPVRWTYKVVEVPRLSFNLICICETKSQMPEGPEVKVISDQLRKLVGRQIVNMTITAKSKYHKKNIPGWERVTYPLLIDGVVAVGKKLVFSLQGHFGPIYMTSTLGLEGHWRYSPDHNTGFIISIGEFIPGPVLMRCTEQYIYYDDTRHFGNITFRSADELTKDLKVIGPDLLSSEVPLSLYTKIIRGKRIAGWPIHKFLMDQSKFAGVGNYLKSEILYAAKINPMRTLSSLSDDDVKALHYHSVSLLRQSYAAGGHSSRTYLAPNGEHGRFIVKVYRQECDPEGRPVVGHKFDDRTTWWVPEVQK